MHCPPSSPENPILHVQVVTVMLPIGELAFAGQLSQMAFLTIGLYFPEKHSIHMLFLLRPENPALHLHIALPSGEFEFARQLMQLASPLSALNEFATHLVQAPPSWPDEPTYRNSPLPHHWPQVRQSLMDIVGIHQRWHQLLLNIDLLNSYNTQHFQAQSCTSLRHTWCTFLRHWGPSTQRCTCRQSRQHSARASGSLLDTHYRKLSLVAPGTSPIRTGNIRQDHWQRKMYPASRWSTSPRHRRLGPLL